MTPAAYRWPRPEVEVGGALVPIDGTWGANAEAAATDRASAAGRARLMELWFGPSWGGLEDPAEALSAACAWHDSAWDALPYGMPDPSGAAARRPPRELLDLSLDAAIISADFLRFYAVDLSSASSAGMCWHEFVSLLMCLTRADGSLVRQAVSARSYDGSARGAARERAEALLGAWALPPSDAELAEAARRAF